MQFWPNKGMREGRWGVRDESKAVKEKGLRGHSVGRMTLRRLEMLVP